MLLAWICLQNTATAANDFERANYVVALARSLHEQLDIRGLNAYSPQASIHLLTIDPSTHKVVGFRTLLGAVYRDLLSVSLQGAKLRQDNATLEVSETGKVRDHVIVKGRRTRNLDGSSGRFLWDIAPDGDGQWSIVVEILEVPKSQPTGGLH